MSVAFLDLKAGYDELREEIDAAVARVLCSGWYIGGPELTQFEEAFAEYCGAEHCVGVANGLDALHLALRALDVGPGDEVIVSGNTFIATLLAVSMVGATPVPVEPDPATHNIDPGRIEAAITQRTRVLLPTHLYGQPADLDALLGIARTHGLKLLEDAAQAHGARYKGRRVGSHGDAVAWSFYPGKNLGAMGDGGAVTSNNAHLVEKIRTLGNYGSRTKYVHDVQGFNSRLDPIQAAILHAKLRHLDTWNARRSAIAAQYRATLGGFGVKLPHVPNWAEPSWHLFVVQVEERRALEEALNACGIQTLVHYPVPPHLQQAFSNLGLPQGSLPITEQLAKRVLSLPISPHMSVEQATKVADSIGDWRRGR